MKLRLIFSAAPFIVLFRFSRAADSSETETLVATGPFSGSEEPTSEEYECCAKKLNWAQMVEGCEAVRGFTGEDPETGKFDASLHGIMYPTVFPFLATNTLLVLECLLCGGVLITSREPYQIRCLIFTTMLVLLFQKSFPLSSYAVVYLFNRRRILYYFHRIFLPYAVFYTSGILGMRWLDSIVECEKIAQNQDLKEFTDFHKIPINTERATRFGLYIIGSMAMYIFLSWMPRLTPYTPFFLCFSFSRLLLSDPKTLWQQ